MLTITQWMTLNFKELESRVKVIPQRIMSSKCKGEERDRNTEGGNLSCGMGKW